MMTMFDWMFDGGTRSRLDRMNGKLDALIEGQKGIVTVLNEGFKETNDILQEILKKIEIRYPNGVAQA